MTTTGTYPYQFLSEEHVMIIKINNGIGLVGENKNVIVWTDSSVHITGHSDIIPNSVVINRFYNNGKSSYESTSKYKFCISFFYDSDDQNMHVSVLAVK
jgi:hypothetical protein